MSVHLQNLTKQVLNLPFNDMVELAKLLKVELDRRHQDDLDAFIIAQALISAVSQPMKLSDVSANEEKIFKRLFSRKRSIGVTYGGHWSVDLSTVSGATAQGTELRATLQQMLDAAVTVHILTKS